MICNECGLPFDESDLSQVLKHEHNGSKLESIDIPSKKVINHARDIYPNCSIQFAMGVHAWIMEGNEFDLRLMYQESDEFKQGFYQAQYQLEDNYKIAR